MSGSDDTGAPTPPEGAAPEETFPADRTFDSVLLGAGLWTSSVAESESAAVEAEEDSGLVVEDVRSQVRDTILAAARQAGVKAVFAEGRRSSDITLVLLKGRRLDVLAFAPALVENLDFDLEVMRSAELDGVYELMLAVTDALEDQSVQQPERRQKLQRFLAEI